MAHDCTLVAVHCGAPMSHGWHLIDADTACTGLACPTAAAGLAESRARIDAARSKAAPTGEVPAVPPGWRTSSKAADLGAADTRAIDAIRAVLTDVSDRVDPLGQIRAIVRQVRP